MARRHPPDTVNGVSGTATDIAAGLGPYHRYLGPRAAGAASTKPAGLALLWLSTVHAPASAEDKQAPAPCLSNQIRHLPEGRTSKDTAPSPNPNRDRLARVRCICRPRTEGRRRRTHVRRRRTKGEAGEDTALSQAGWRPRSGRCTDEELGIFSRWRGGRRPHRFRFQQPLR